MLKRALLASTALVAMASPALADPVSLVLAGVNALFGASLATSTALITVAGSTILTAGQAVGLALAVGASLAMSAFSGGQRANIDPGAAKSTFQSTEMGAWHAVGTCRIGGLQAYGNTKNYDTYRLIAHAVEPIEQIIAHYLGGRLVTVENDGDVSTPPYAKFGMGTGGDTSYAVVKNASADPNQAAWPELVTAFPSYWTSAHRLRGISQTLIRHISPGVQASNYLKLRSGGVPEYQLLARFGSFYDPRDGVYRWTDNGIIIALYVALYAGKTLDQFDLDLLKAECDRADAIVATRTGSEKRSRVSGIWDEASGSRDDILAQILESAGAEQVNTKEGKIYFRLIDENRPATIHIPAKHIRSVSLKSGPESAERPNKYLLKHYAPQQRYEVAELDLVHDRAVSAPVPLDWAHFADEIEGDSVKHDEVKLPFCFSAAQAQRIARRLIAWRRADRFQIETDMAGLSCWHHKTISFDVEWSDVPVVLEVSSVNYAPGDGVVTITGIAQPYLAPWVPATHEAMPLDQLPEQEYDAEIATPAKATSAIVVTYPDGSKELRVVYPDASSYVVEAMWADVSDGLWLHMDEVGTPTFAWASGATIPAQISFRHRLFDATMTTGSNWSEFYLTSPSIDNAAPDVPVLSWGLTVTAPASMSVAYVSVKIGSAAAVNYAARPSQIVTVSALPSGAVVKAHASDGTASAGVTVP